MDKMLKSLIDILEFEKLNGRQFYGITESLNIESYDSINNDLKQYTACRLNNTCIQKVMGKGSVNAQIMIIGEAPGADEDAAGEPFVGKAGEKLEKMLEYINLTRREVYITNIVKCRPPGNADPEEESIEKCIGYLKREIKLVSPLYILTLGRFAARVVTGKSDRRMADYLNKEHSSDGIPVIATYHPSAMLHSKGEKLNEIRQQVGKDMRKLKQIMEIHNGH